MATYFMDSSAVVKRYATEVGSSWVRALCEDEDNVIILAEITLAEVAAAFSRLLREGKLTEDERRDYLDLFIGDCNTRYQLVAIERAIIDTAVDLTQAYPLRGYDAVQLAAAIAAKKAAGAPADFIFACSDDRLLAAAQDKGLATENPNLHEVISEESE